MVNLSGNSVSEVYREGPWIIKRQPLYLTDNEWRGLTLMEKYGFAPTPVRVSDEVIKTLFLQSDSSFNPDVLLKNCARFLDCLKEENIRHGDLTEPHIFIVDNSIKVIDWAESRWGNDPAPDKRREGDSFWMWKTMRLIFKKSGIGSVNLVSEIIAPI